MMYSNQSSYSLTGNAACESQVAIDKEDGWSTTEPTLNCFGNWWLKPWYLVNSLAFGAFDNTVLSIKDDFDSEYNRKLKLFTCIDNSS
jgi:hypothetical protein